MTSINPAQYLNKYAEVTEALDAFVHQLAHTPEMVRKPELEFERINQLVVGSEPPPGFNNPFVSPELLNAKINVVRACIEVHFENFDEAERCLESAICCADAVSMRGAIENWISESITQASPIHGTITELLENARHNLSFDTATHATDDLSNVSFSAASDEYQAPNQQPVAETTAVIDPRRLSGSIDTIVLALSKSADMGLIGELFDNVNSQLEAASRNRGTLSMEELGLLDARHHIVAALVTATNSPASEQVQMAFEEARDRARYWGKISELELWKEQVIDVHPALRRLLGE